MKLRIALAATCAFISFVAVASEYPAKQIRIIGQFTPGTSTDILARLIAAKMGERWNQQVVVDNKPGAGAVLGTGIANAPGVRADTIAVTGGQLRYVNCPVSPFLDTTATNVCNGI